MNSGLHRLLSTEQLEPLPTRVILYCGPLEPRVIRQLGLKLQTHIHTLERILSDPFLQRFLQQYRDFVSSVAHSWATAVARIIRFPQAFPFMEIPLHKAIGFIAWRQGLEGPPINREPAATSGVNDTLPPPEPPPLPKPPTIPPPQHRPGYTREAPRLRDKAIIFVRPAAKFTPILPRRPSPTPGPSSRGRSRQRTPLRSKRHQKRCRENSPPSPTELYSRKKGTEATPTSFPHPCFITLIGN